MFEGLSFAASIPLWLVIITSGFCCVGWLVSNIGIVRRLRHNKTRMIGVIGVNTLFCLAMAVWLNGVSWRHEGQQTLWLFTPNTEQVLQDLSIIEQWQAGDQFAQLNGHSTRLDRVPEQTKVVTNIQQLADLVGQYQQWAIVGDGLSPEQWTWLELMMETLPKPLVFEATPQQFGVVDAVWQHSLALGEPLSLNAKLTGSHDDQKLYRALLIDPANEVVAEQTLRVGDRFTMQTVPKAIGLWQFQLAISGVQQDDEVLQQQDIAFEVVPGKPLQVLMWLSAPTFEARHLQNWLADSNSKILLDLSISRDVSKTQFINFEQQQIEQLQQSTRAERLAQFDVLMIDWRKLQQLDANEIAMIEQAIRNGLGVHVWLDVDAVGLLGDKSIPWLASFEAKPWTESYETALPIWATGAGDKPLPIHPVSLSKSGIVHEVSASTGEALVQLHTIDQGRVLISILNSSYQWRLEGNTQAHSEYWAYLLSKLARSDEQSTIQFEQYGVLATAHQAIRLCVTNTQQPWKIASRTHSSGVSMSDLATYSSSILPEQFCTSVWPADGGWQAYSATTEEQSASAHLYIYEPQDWQPWRQAASIRATTARLQPANSPTVLTQESTRPMHRLPWFVLVLILATILWIERRLSAQSVSD